MPATTCRAPCGYQAVGSAAVCCAITFVIAIGGVAGKRTVGAPRACETDPEARTPDFGVFLFCLRGETEIIRRFERRVPGSNPGGGIQSRLKNVPVVEWTTTQAREA